MPEKKVNKYRQNCGLKHKHYINLLFINMSHLIKTLILKDIDWSAYFDWVKKESSSANAGSVLKRFKAVANWAKARGQIKHSHLIDIPIKGIGSYQQKRE